MNICKHCASEYPEGETCQHPPEAMGGQRLRIHSLLFILSMAGRSSAAFTEHPTPAAMSVNMLADHAKMFAERVPKINDIRDRITANNQARAMAAGQNTLARILSSVQVVSVIGNGNLADLQEGIEWLQESCGCSGCLKARELNRTARLTRPGPRIGAKFTGYFADWPKQAQERAIGPVEVEPSRIIKP